MPRGRATGTLQGSGVRVVRPTGWCRGQEDGPKGVTRRLDWYPPGAWEDGSPYHAPGLGGPAKRVPQTVPGGAVCGVSCMKADTGRVAGGCGSAGGATSITAKQP